jgi:hypothetical protein
MAKKNKFWNNSSSTASASKDDEIAMLMSQINSLSSKPASSSTSSSASTESKDVAQAIVIAADKVVTTMREGNNQVKEHQVTATNTEAKNSATNAVMPQQQAKKIEDNSKGFYHINDTADEFLDASKAMYGIAKKAGSASLAGGANLTVSEGMKALNDIWDSSGFSNVISRQATNLFEGSVKNMVEKDVRRFAQAGVMPNIEEIEGLMDVARAENKVYKETMNYIDIKSWDKQFGTDFLGLRSLQDKLGFR